MSTVSLPIYESSSAARLTQSLEIDRSKAYPSCNWLEGGLAFRWRSLNACLVCHRNRGFPTLRDYNGGPLDLDDIMAARAQIIRENQTTGHEHCRGCPQLVTKKWPTPRYAFTNLAFAHFAHCNIECNYCYLQWQDPAVFEAGYQPYQVLPIVKDLIDRGLLSPKTLVDWGGGEPTIYKEFDDVLRVLTDHGAVTFVHTNGTRVPKPFREGLTTKRFHLVCSVDAGLPETWKLIKKRDLLEKVWENLEEYVRIGCRVILKYIMKDENCSGPELLAFVTRAVALGARELVLDIDYTHSPVSPAVIAGLRFLNREATLRGMHVRFGSTGSQLSAETDIASRIDFTSEMRPLQRLHVRGRRVVAEAQMHVRNVARRLRPR